MDSAETIYILGAGAIGFPLAAYLAARGERVVAVRTSQADAPRGTATITLRGAEQTVRSEVATIGLAGLGAITGTVVVTAKAYANPELARALAAKQASGPIVLLQNGVGVERPFVAAGFPELYRCVLYITSQALGEHEFSLRPVSASPIGVVSGSAEKLRACVERLSSPGFPFRVEDAIQREVWKKAIANAVFNSICPLLEVDNGVFARDEAVAGLAREVVRECVVLTERLGLGLGEDELMAQIRTISQRADGQLISTLQDLRAGRPTEIDSLNLEIARIAAAQQPPLDLPRTALLGRLIAAKSATQRGAR